MGARAVDWSRVTPDSAVVLVQDPEHLGAKPHLAVPALSAAGQRDQASGTWKTLRRQRLETIKAALVRIIKARRRMHRRELILEVKDQLKRVFDPQPDQIKRAIEVLMAASEQYLAADEQDASILVYVS